ncbi:hypothetical protein DEJ15_13170 [Curtobacterium sp. MCJR17_043]|nr:hypothetical protein [Curtobacterium sp. MCJR17_043]WIB35279.1 hypothetical protein DEJ15_13170 [Curtobacterium sp. MCJR17_043]
MFGVGGSDQAGGTQLVDGALVPPVETLEAGTGRGHRAGEVDDGHEERADHRVELLEDLPDRPRPVDRHDELVRVGVDDPVRAVDRCGLARHRRDDDALLLPVHRVVSQVHRDVVPLGEGGEQLGRAVHRPVVGDDEDVEALGDVVVEPGGDDVRFIADHQGDGEDHGVRSGSGGDAP